MEKPQLLMIGTNHFDENGGAKIRTSLGNFRPDLILVEGGIESHRINQAAKEAALSVLAQKRAGPKFQELVLFERDSQLRDIDAVLAYAESAPPVNLDFFRETELRDIEDTRRQIATAAQSAFESISRFPKDRQRQLLEKAINDIRNNMRQNGEIWRHVANTDNEPNLAEVLRRNNPITGPIIERDKRMWTVLRDVIEGNPAFGKIATVTGAAHILRTREGTSLFDLARDSTRFEIERAMVFAELA